MLANLVSRATKLYDQVMSDFISVFTRASKLMRGAADAAFSRHGVRVGQNLVLERLWEEDGLAPGEIAQRLGVSTPTVVKMATRMEAAGLLERRPDERDARLVRLYLTRRGRSLRQPLEDERKRLSERATANLTAAERRQFEAALARMVDNLEDVERIEPDDG
jgi:MarR family transcriptional regulator, organic hydroperoxide resistance regulator